MTEIHSDDGNLIATIHDGAGFIAWLDKYEELLRAYSFFRPPWRYMARINLLVREETIIVAKEAAKRLKTLREQLGDTRDNLYPTELPSQS